MIAKPATVRSEKSYTRQEIAARRTFQAPRRHLAGTRVHDLAALGKAILLCSTCRPKFNEASVNYATNADIPYARGQCDGCLAFTPQGQLFLKG